MNNFKFYVSRQHQYHEQKYVVEIAQGGLDYSGADMLVSKYTRLGEGQEYIGMVAAMEAAIAIARQWKLHEKDKPKGKREKNHIVHGCTHGMFTELPDAEPFTEKLATQLLKAAKEFDSHLPHCARCGGLLQKERFGNPTTMGMGGEEAYPFCSENCAENDWAEEMALLEEEAEAELED